MPRHSKNANTRTFNSYYEKKKGTSENRPLVYDSDAIKPFDYCTLCLHHATNPMCCEEGHLFCNDCILQYLVTKMKEYEELMENYEVAMAELERQHEEQQTTIEETICSTIEEHQTVGGTESKHLFVSSNDSKEDKKLKEMKMIVDKLSCKFDDRTDEQKSLKKIFWLPENTPEYQEIVQKPSKAIHCPSSDHEISRKKIYSLHFSEEGGEFVCPACLKPFKHQKVIAMKSCGHVMCADCFKKFVGASKQCFVCQSPVVKKKDFIQMEAGGTSFSSHNKIAVKVYTPTEN